jgi:MoxR-like ATPase
MTTAAVTSFDRLAQLEAALNASFLERRELVRGALCAVLAGEHVLLLGPPGTGKSAIVRAIAQAFGGTYFERLLTKFSTPEELFGPISLSALEQDRYARITAGKLPEAHFAFADEVWKASSAILNSLLALVNERIYHNDGAPMQCPLVSFFGASNELPDGKDLEALFDRFLLRFDVQYLLRPSSFRSVVLSPDPTVASTLTLAELEAMQQAVRAITVTDATIDALLQIRDAAKAEGIVVSDRRWKKSLRAVQASAYLARETATCPEDLLILSDCLWRDQKERPTVARLVGKLADPASAQAREILDAARETAARIAGIRSTKPKDEFMSEATRAIKEYEEQKKKLAGLASGAGPRASQTIQEAQQEIVQLHQDLGRNLAAGLGLRLR